MHFTISPLILRAALLISCYLLSASQYHARFNESLSLASTLRFDKLPDYLESRIDNALETTAKRSLRAQKKARKKVKRTASHLYSHHAPLHPRDIAATSLAKAVTQGLQVLVVSHGGVGSNSFVDFLENNGLVSKSAMWHSHLCHLDQPPAAAKFLAIRGLKLAVYMYGDPVLAICSMKRRGIAARNLDKLNSFQTISKYSDKALLAAMYRQFKSWTAAAKGGTSSSPTATERGFSVVAMRYDEAFSTTCLTALFKHLGLPVPSNNVDTATNIITWREEKQRRTSDRAGCLNDLVLDDEHLQLAQEMISYQSRSLC